jgi:hypothetical protein
MPEPPVVSSAEDLKLITLARSARARITAAEGASVRDTDGRTYAAATVSLPSLRLTALQLAVAQAVAAGARGVEAVAVVTAASGLDPDGLAAVGDLAAAAGPGARPVVLLAAPDGSFRAVNTL